ncbi:LuxR family transcriptional regulator [Streptomyces sp. A0592]|nr:LuxR family transcriptional regulator [Streptomyces sp. A0592]
MRRPAPSAPRPRNWASASSTRRSSPSSSPTSSPPSSHRRRSLLLQVDGAGKGALGIRLVLAVPELAVDVDAAGGAGRSVAHGDAVEAEADVLGDRPRQRLARGLRPVGLLRPAGLLSAHRGPAPTLDGRAGATGRTTGAGARPARPRRPSRHGHHRAGPGGRTLVARGRTNNEFATEPTLAVSTIKSHLNRIRERLPARNRVEIAAWAWDHGLVS